METPKFLKFMFTIDDITPLTSFTNNDDDKDLNCIGFYLFLISVQTKKLFIEVRPVHIGYLKLDVLTMIVAKGKVSRTMGSNNIDYFGKTKDSGVSVKVRAL